MSRILGFTRTLAGCCWLTGACLATTALAYDWLQFNGDPQHSGNNTKETAVHRNNVGRMVLKWQSTLLAYTDGAPVFLEAVNTPSGTKDVLYVTSVNGHIIALDAATGAQLWSHQYGPGTCKINGGASACYTNSSPAIDPNRQFVYSYGLDGFVHKYQVGDGVEISTGGWPQLATLKGFDEKSASALSFATVGATTYLYAVNGGYPGDNGDYQGHVTAINLGTGAQNVFNVNCSNQTVHLARMPATPNCGSARSAIWSRPGVTYHAGTNRIYMATGNGNFNGDTGGFNWGDSVIATTPAGTGQSGKPLDAYTPANQATLEAQDADLGSTAPAVLPVPTNAIYQHLAVQSGKDAKMRLINLDNLNGSGGPGPLSSEIATVINLPQGGAVLSQPAVWVNHVDGIAWTFIVNGNGASGTQVLHDAGGVPSLAPQWNNGSGGGSPLVANNLVFFAGGNTLRALDPKTGTTLWSNSRIGGTHWQSPIVANGVAYVADNSGKLSAFVGAGAGLLVDAHSGTGTVSNANGILEPGESVLIEPGWRNVTASSVTLTGTATALAGPPGATYTINDSAASYATIASGASANCATATANCYRITINNPATRPALNWSITLRETLSNGDTASHVLHIGGSFPDVPTTDLMYPFIETLLHNGVTLGFADGTFHPADPSGRGASAMFVARAAVAPNGEGGLPATGLVGIDPYQCIAGGTSLFIDVGPLDVWCKQVHALAARGVNVSYQCTDSFHACPSASTLRASLPTILSSRIFGYEPANSQVWKNGAQSMCSAISASV